MELRDAEIGGAFVRRAFSRDGRRVRPGTQLSADEILGLARNNRRALIAGGFLEVYPRPPIESVTSSDGTMMHKVHTGRGNYDVIRGVKLNIEPLTLEQADELITRPAS